VKNVDATLIGIEQNGELIASCNATINSLDMSKYASFSNSTIAQWKDEMHDKGSLALIALHACDTATDIAMHKGVAAGASLIVCAQCCHKQIRPQLLSPQPLRPILKHGVHLGQEAEMITDSLRALLLEACGYDTQVFEFISLEHTNKNKMILAVKREQSGSSDTALAQVRAIKDFYGLKQQALEQLLSLS